MNQDEQISESLHLPVDNGTSPEPEISTGTNREMTSSRKTVNELKDKTNLLTNLILNLQEGILLEDANRTVILTNQQFCDMFGIQGSPESLIGADCSNAAEPNKVFFKNPDQFIAKINMLLAHKIAMFNDPLELIDGRHFERDYIPTYLDNQYSGHLWKYRDVTERKKAEQVIHDLNANLAFTVNERTAQLQVTNENLQKEIEEHKWAREALQQSILIAERDITDRKKAEALLEQTRQNYQTFFNTIDDFLFVLDEKGNIIHTNSTVTQRLEYSTDELNGMSVLEVHPVERREEAGRIVGEMLTGKADFCPVPLITKSCKPIPVETRVKHGYWDGKPVIFGVSKDVSKLHLSEEKFSKAFHTSAAMMAISTYHDGRFIDVNNAVLKVLGYSRDEIIGQSSTKLKLYPDAEFRNKIITKLEQNIPVRDVEAVLITKSGAPIIGLFSASSIYIGNDLCLLTVVVDISEIKRTEEDLRKARIEADKANQAKSEFLSRMSHELRTPMNSILGFAQLMKMGELNPTQRNNVSHILNSGKHLLNLINEVLDIAGIEAGRLKLSLEPVNLYSLIWEMIEIVQPIAAQRNGVIECDQPKDSGLFVMSDSQRLKQVLLNLFDNAVKYGSEGGSVTITTRLLQKGDPEISMVRVLIHDTGFGIQPENLDKLFLPFERIGAENSATQGTGLGLTVVKKLMDAMGGTIGVESTDGHGNTFWIELPQAEEPKTGSKQTKENPPSDVLLNGKTGTILYIEDNVSNAELVEEIIGNHRPEIRIFTSVYGMQAVKLAKDYLPDLILLDLDLPDIPGSKVLENLHENDQTKAIPVVIISADAMSDTIEHHMNAGAMDYLTKPIDINMFLQVVDEWIGEKGKSHR